MFAFCVWTDASETNSVCLDDWGIIMWPPLIQSNILKWFAISCSALLDTAVPTALAVCFHTFLLIIRAYSDSVLKYNKLVSAIMINILTVIPDYNTLRVCILSPALRECCKTCFQGVMSVLSLQWVGREGRVKNKAVFLFSFRSFELVLFFTPCPALRVERVWLRIIACEGILSAWASPWWHLFF